MIPIYNHRNPTAISKNIFGTTSVNFCFENLVFWEIISFYSRFKIGLRGNICNELVIQDLLVAAYINHLMDLKVKVLRKLKKACFGA